MRIFDATTTTILESWDWKDFDFNTVAIRFSSSEIILDGVECWGLYDGCSVRVSNLLDDVRKQSIIVHEMRHVWQDVHELLYGVVSPSACLVAYENTPTERDARLWENIYLARKTYNQEYMTEVKMLRQYELLSNH